MVLPSRRTADVRNTKVIDIYKALKEYNLNITVYDPWANPAIVEREYGIKVNELEEKFDAAITAVAHKKFEGLDIPALLKEKHVIFDVKALLTEILLMEDYVVIYYCGTAINIDNYEYIKSSRFNYRYIESIQKQTYQKYNTSLLMGIQLIIQKKLLIPIMTHILNISN